MSAISVASTLGMTSPAPRISTDKTPLAGLLPTILAELLSTPRAEDLSADKRRCTQIKTVKKNGLPSTLFRV
jgi:hypothetical protein